MFGVTNIVKNSDKEKWVYIGYGAAFDGTGSWNFGNDLVKNVVIFCVDNSSSSHADNCKNNLLVLGEDPTNGINGSFGAPEKRLIINFSIAIAKSCLILYYNGDNSYLFLNGKEIFKFKADNKNVNFSTQFCLGSTSNEFGAAEFREHSSAFYVQEQYKIMFKLIK